MDVTFAWNLLTSAVETAANQSSIKTWVVPWLRARVALGLVQILLMTLSSLFLVFDVSGLWHNPGSAHTHTSGFLSQTSS